jgi:hypothetical protein
MCERGVMQVRQLVDMCEHISTFKFVNLKVGEKLASANRPLVSQTISFRFMAGIKQPGSVFVSYFLVGGRFSTLLTKPVKNNLLYESMCL